jgi:hypothetical protein
MRYELIVNSLLFSERKACRQGARRSPPISAPRSGPATPPFHGSIRCPSRTRFNVGRRGDYGVSLSGWHAQQCAGGLAEPKPARMPENRRHRVTICLHIAKQLRLVVTNGTSLQRHRGNTKRDAGDVLGGDGSQRRRFCGETASARQAFTALRLVRTAVQMLQKTTDPEISGW